MLEDGQQHIFRKAPPHTQRKKTIKETLVEGICGNFYRRLILYWFWKSIHEQRKTNQSNHRNRLITAMAMDSSTKFVDVWIKFCLYFTVYIYFSEKMCVLVTAELQKYVGSLIFGMHRFQPSQVFSSSQILHTFHGVAIVHRQLLSLVDGHGAPVPFRALGDFPRGSSLRVSRGQVLLRPGCDPLPDICQRQ